MSVIALSSASPAMAELVGYDCAEHADLPFGVIGVSRSIGVSGQLLGDRIEWRPFSEPTQRFGFSEIKVLFATPRSPEAPPVAVSLTTRVGLQGNPRYAVYFVARMGDAIKRETLYLPRPYPFPMRSPGVAGYTGDVVLEGAAFREAYRRGEPLELYLQRGDGKILDQRIERLDARTAAARALSDRWRSALEKAADPKGKCFPVTIEE